MNFHRISRRKWLWSGMGKRKEGPIRAIPSLFDHTARNASIIRSNYQVALLIGSPHLGLTLLDVGIGSRFHLPDFSPQEILWHLLQLQFALAIIDDPIQSLGMGIGLLVEAVIAFTRLVFTLACTPCPARLRCGVFAPRPCAAWRPQSSRPPFWRNHDSCQCPG